MSTSADSDGGGDNGGDGRKGYGKRELSTSKRAAQNRAAQRAFRQRKEGYIKKLEEQVRDYGMLNENYKAVQAENYQLRDYIINLQSRLLESQGEFPPPPSNVDGLHPGKGGPMSHSGKSVLPVSAPVPPPSSSSSDIAAINVLRAAADDLAGAERRDLKSIPTGSSYLPPDSSRAKRPRVDSHEMNAAQEALQGPAPKSETLGNGREEVVLSR